MKQNRLVPILQTIKVIKAQQIYASLHDLYDAMISKYFEMLEHINSTKVLVFLILFCFLLFCTDGCLSPNGWVRFDASCLIQKQNFDLSKVSHMYKMVEQKTHFKL